MDAHKLGNFIQRCRKDLGMTQGELSDKLNVTDKAISRWERGVGFPDIKLLNPLAEALQVTTEELIQCRRIHPDVISAESSVPLKSENTSAPKKNRRVLAIVCFLFYTIIFVLSRAAISTNQLEWLSPLEKVLFFVTVFSFLFASYRHFRLLWIVIPTCASCILKLIRILAYFFYLNALSSMDDGGVIILVSKAALAFNGFDTLIFILLFAALLGIMQQLRFESWYNKVSSTLN